MREFTLTTFVLSHPENPDLTEIGTVQICAPDAAGGKHWLSKLISQETLRAGYFYRFEADGEFRELRPFFCFNISFHLFEGGRICPVRIWRREERYGMKGAGADWTIDFNGLPGWSQMAAIEPRWYRLRSSLPARPRTGTSAKDWYLRDCWTVAVPSLLREVVEEDSVAYAGGVLGAR